MEKFGELMRRCTGFISLLAASGTLYAQAPYLPSQTPPRATPIVSSPSTSAVSAAPTAAGTAREGLRDQAREWMASQTGTEAALVNIGALDGRVDPPVCDNGYRFDFPFESRTTIRAICERPVRQYYMRASVERPRQRVVMVRPMAAGEIIGPSDLMVKDVAGSSAGLDNPSQAVGRALRRSVTAGESPLTQDLEEIIPVLRTTREMRAGESISGAASRIEQLPRSRVPAAALTRTDDLSRARLRRDVPADRILVADDLTDTRQVVVARRNLMRGETIDGSALEVIEMDRRAVPADHLSSPQGLEQAEMTGMVKAGEPLRASMVRPALLVRKGQSVMLSVARAGIEISVQVEALEDARLGDQVKLRNPESGKALGGLVTGRGAARAL